MIAIDKELSRINTLIEVREKADQDTMLSRNGFVVLYDGSGMQSYEGDFYNDANADFFALAANELKSLLENYKRALELIEYYADSTNFEAVNVGMNYMDEFVVEEYNKQTVSGDEMGSAARKFLGEL